MAKKTPQVTENNVAPQEGSVRSKKSKMLQAELQAPAVETKDSKGASTDSKPSKKVAKKSDKPNIFKRIWKAIKGVISEMKKVTWPKGKDVVKSTAVVLVVVVVFFVILFGIDYVLAGILSLIVSGQWATVFI